MAASTIPTDTKPVEPAKAGRNKAETKKSANILFSDQAIYTTHLSIAQRKDSSLLPSPLLCTLPSVVATDDSGPASDQGNPAGL